MLANNDRLTGPRLCTSHRVPPLEVPEAHLRRGIRHGSNNAQFAARGAHPVRAEEVIALASEHVEAVWKTTTIERKVSPSARERCGHGSLLRGNDRRLGASHRMHLCSTPSDASLIWRPCVLVLMDEIPFTLQLCGPAAARQARCKLKVGCFGMAADLARSRPEVAGLTLASAGQA